MTVTSTVAAKTTAPNSCTISSRVISFLSRFISFAVGSRSVRHYILQGILQVLFAPVIVSVQHQLHLAVLDQEEPGHPLDVVPGGELAVAFLQHCVGGAAFLWGAVYVDGREGCLVVAVLVRLLRETRLRLVGALVQGAPEREHVDALVRELEALAFRGPRGELGGAVARGRGWLLEREGPGSRLGAAERAVGERGDEHHDRDDDQALQRPYQRELGVRTTTGAIISAAPALVARTFLA